MRVTIILIFFISISLYARKPAQYKQQMQAVNQSLKGKTKSKKIELMKDFINWMESNNAQEMKIIIQADVSSELKSQVHENRMIYFNLKPLSDVFLTENKMPADKECKKLISDVQYNDRIGKPTESPELSQRARDISELLSNFCLN